MTSEKETTAASRKAPETGNEKKTPEKDSLLQQLTGSDEEEGFSALMRSLAGGDFLAGKWFRRQISFIFLLVVLTLAYTTCRYACQKELSVRQQLTDTLIDRQYKALTISSEFKERTRGSKIEEQLTDSTLHSPVKPLFTLSVSRKQDESKTKDRSEH